MSFITIVEDSERIPKKFGDSTIYYRRYSTAVHNVLQRGFRKRRKDRQGQFYFDVDEDGLNNAILDYVIIDLENVKDGSGKNVKATMETKLSLPGDVIEGIMQDSGAASIRGDKNEPDPI